MRNLCVAVLAVGALGLGGCAFQGGVNPNHFKYESRVYDGPIRGRALIEMPKAVQDEKFIGKPTSLTGAATNLTLQIGGFTLGGIGTATFGAILLYALLNRKSVEALDEEPQS